MYSYLAIAWRRLDDLLPTDPINRDFPYGLMPTTVAGLSDDVIKVPKIDKLFPGSNKRAFAAVHNPGRPAAARYNPLVLLIRVPNNRFIMLKKKEKKKICPYANVSTFCKNTSLIAFLGSAAGPIGCIPAFGNAQEHMAYCRAPKNAPASHF
jgi:hypothetical protein